MKIIPTSLFLLLIPGSFAPLLAATSSMQPVLSKQVSSLTDRADRLLDQGQYLDAASNYQQALALLPEPVQQWSACSWLTVSLGDSYYFAGDYESAREALQLAMDCQGVHWNPYARLRLGQVQMELGNCEQAADELTFALANAGYEIFEGEPPQYLAFAAGLLSQQLAAGGALQC